MAKQRTRTKQESKKYFCVKGHELVRTLVVPPKGRQMLQWVCSCSGYNFTTCKDNVK